MGWTAYHVSGKIDKKAEVEKNLCCKVVKSVVKGNVWYGACEVEEGRVIGAVVLISIRNRDYYNFAYKIIDESMGPGESECPESILKLLYPTNEEYAIQWRNRCHEYNARKSQLSKLPFGARVICGDKEWKKSEYRGKVKWICWESYTYLAETMIARRGYKLIEEV